MFMRAEYAKHPRPPKNQPSNNLLRYFTYFEVFTYWDGCFCMKKSPSDGFRIMNQFCFCASIFPSCNINSRGFLRSTVSAFLCSSKILSISSCIRNSLSWSNWPTLSISIWVLLFWFIKYHCVQSSKFC